VAGDIQLTTVSTTEEVRQILDLQMRNLPASLSPETMASQGFVTVRHEPGVLQEMNDRTPAIIAKARGQVIAYALVMPREFASSVPVLEPLFRKLDTLSWNGAPLRDNPRWFVMGQICVDEAFRGSGVFDGLYTTMSKTYRDRYDFTVTEVAERNTRSLRAHERVGFQTLHTYPDGVAREVWRVVVLDFNVGR
jgi:ribosomal protein S18 acetylase RimI-like enzyme